MSAQIDHVQVAGGPRAINLGPAAAIGIALLVIGLGIGLIVGRLQPGSAEPTASNPAASEAPASTKVPALSWKDDYATRHPTAATKAPVLSGKDDYTTRHRHLGELSAAKTKVLDGRHRHLGELH
jgi:hypothetical protein